MPKIGLTAVNLSGAESLFTAAAQILEIPETELGGTMYEKTKWEAPR